MLTISSHAAVVRGSCSSMLSQHQTCIRPFSHLAQHDITDRMKQKKVHTLAHSHTLDRVLLANMHLPQRPQPPATLAPAAATHMGKSNHMQACPALAQLYVKKIR